MSFNTNTDIWFAGAFAAFSVDLLVYPLDTLKTRIQSPDYQTLYKPSAAPSAAPQAGPRVASSSARALLSPSLHFNPSLFRGLYQGVSTIILVTIPSAGAFFTTYEALKTTIAGAIPPNSTLYLPEAAINAASSGGAELVSCAILTPAEVLKQNAQVFRQQHHDTKAQIAGADGKGKARGGPLSSPTVEVIRQFRTHPTKLFRGYSTLAARNLPFTGLQFPLFEHLKTYFLDRRKQKKQNRGDEDGKVDGIFERAQITALSAALAGTGAAWITTPIDVVKTRIMLGAGQEAAGTTTTTTTNTGGSRSSNQERSSGSKSTKSSTSSPSVRKGQQTAMDVIRVVLRTEGVRGMFRGALLRSVWTAFGSGLYLACYEGGRHYLEAKRKGRENEEDRRWEEGDVTNKWKDVRVGIGSSRSQGEKVRKSAWQE